MAGNMFFHGSGTRNFGNGIMMFNGTQGRMQFDDRGLFLNDGQVLTSNDIDYIRNGPIKKPEKK